MIDMSNVRKCGICGLYLIVGDNWYSSFEKYHVYRCISCDKKRKADPEYIKRKNELQRKHRMEDPERFKEYDRRKIEKRKERALKDPEYAKRLKEIRDKAVKKYRDKNRNNPEYIERRRTNQRKLYAKDPEKFRAKMREYYVKNKERFFEYNKIWREAHPEEARRNACNATAMWRERNPKYSKEYGQDIKREVFSYYCDGIPHCQHEGCMVTELEFLTIDHINGGGNKHRKKIGKWGYQFYRWLRDNGYPDGYQILCWNHNIGREYPMEKLSKQQKYHLKIKMEILSHYSNGGIKCICCGETDVAHLCLDHINNNGSEERKESGTKGGFVFYLWLRKQGYPSGYRVLCHNCNGSLGAYGYCPHHKP
jgi:hypothetical protein